MSHFHRFGRLMYGCAVYLLLAVVAVVVVVVALVLLHWLMQPKFKLVKVFACSFKALLNSPHTEAKLPPCLVLGFEVPPPVVRATKAAFDRLRLLPTITVPAFAAGAAPPPHAGARKSPAERALAATAPMLAELRAAARFALVALPTVLANGGTSAGDAVAAVAVVLANPGATTHRGVAGGVPPSLLPSVIPSLLPSLLPSLPSSLLPFLLPSLPPSHHLLLLFFFFFLLSMVRATPLDAPTRPSNLHHTAPCTIFTPRASAVSLGPPAAAAAVLVISMARAPLPPLHLGAV